MDKIRLSTSLTIVFKIIGLLGSIIMGLFGFFVLFVSDNGFNYAALIFIVVSILAFIQIQTLRQVEYSKDTLYIKSWTRTKQIPIKCIEKIDYSIFLGQFWYIKINKTCYKRTYIIFIPSLIAIFLNGSVFIPKTKEIDAFKDYLVNYKKLPQNNTDAQIKF